MLCRIHVLTTVTLERFFEFDRTKECSKSDIASVYLRDEGARGFLEFAVSQRYFAVQG